MANQKLTVPLLTEKTRLDKFLVKELGADWSRSAIQHAIEKGAILINNQQVPVHHWLKPGEVIELLTKEPPTKPKIQPTKEIIFEIVHEAHEFIIINKPAGLIVHPAPGINEPTLIDGLVARYPELITLGDDPLRPGIVHRLDKEASGLMVIARHTEMWQHLKNAFAERLVNKIYTALVVGQMTKPEGMINFPLSRGRGRAGRIAARPQTSEDTRQAITEFVVQRQYQQTALLKIKIITGRTHQIRAHLLAIGHPIVGDRVYRPKNLAFKASPGRLFLHASNLAFPDSTGKILSFISPLPAELEKFLNSLS